MIERIIRALRGMSWNDDLINMGASYRLGLFRRGVACIAGFRLVVRIKDE